MRSFSRLSFSAGAAWVALAALGQADAQPQAPARVEAPRDLSLSIALGEAIRDERWEEAQALIETLSAAERAAPEVRFIEAFIARRMGRPQRAIALYQGLLDEDDSLARVRAELAQTFLEIGDDRAAEYNFRLALATTADPVGQRLIQGALDEIAARRRWRYTVSFAVGPDSNVNAATDAEQIEIFGLPFELSDEARRTEGVSATLAVGAERAFPGPGQFDWIVGGGVRVSDNEQAAFDDAQANARAGLQWFEGGWRMETALTYDRRWFGGAWFSEATGVDVRARYGTGRVVQELGAQAQFYDYDLSDERDGFVYGADWSRTSFLSSRRFWRAALAVRRADAESASEAFWGARVSAGAYQALPYGWAVYAEPAVETRIFDEASLLTPEPREDVELSLSARVLKRDLRVFGYSPYVGVLLARNESNNDVEDYDRARVEFGISRTF